MNNGVAMAQFADVILDSTDSGDHVDIDLEHLPSDLRQEIERYPTSRDLLDAAYNRLLRSDAPDLARARMLRRHAEACFTEVAARTERDSELDDLHDAATANTRQLLGKPARSGAR